MGSLKSCFNGEKHSISTPSKPGRELLTSWRTKTDEFDIFQEMWRNGFGLSTQKLSPQFPQWLLWLLCNTPAGPWTSWLIGLDSCPSIPFLNWFLFVHLPFNRYSHATHVLEIRQGTKNGGVLRRWEHSEETRADTSFKTQTRCGLLQEALLMMPLSCSVHSRIRDSRRMVLHPNPVGENQGPTPDLPRKSFQEQLLESAF